MITQNSDSARRQSMQLSASARSVMSFGSHFSGRRLSALTMARYRLTVPGPDSTRSAETCPTSARSTSRMMSSSSLFGAKSTWPPSPGRLTQRRSTCTVSNAQPGTGAIHRNRFARLRIAAAKLQHVVRREHRDRHRDGGEIVDHFQMAQPRLAFISLIENAQLWLVIATQSSVTGQAIAIQASCTSISHAFRYWRITASGLSNSGRNRFSPGNLTRRNSAQRRGHWCRQHHLRGHRSLISSPQNEK